MNNNKREDKDMKNLLFITAALLLMLLTGCAVKKGDQGPAGANGFGCTVSPATDNSGALIKCGDGSSYFVKNGQDATPVQMIQLCPNLQGSYPNNFPEFAFLIQGKYYATMNINNKSFIAQLYPGTYATTTNSANCAFTVTADGHIINQ